jgi:hypothetical protein
MLHGYDHNTIFEDAFNVTHPTRDDVTRSLTVDYHGFDTIPGCDPYSTPRRNLCATHKK